MKIGVISDTHDVKELVEQAVEFFERNADKVIHCGDMTRPSTAELFDADFEFYAVKGNNDTDEGLAERINGFGEWLGKYAELELEGYRFVIYHGTDFSRVRDLVASGDYSYVLKGHTHREIVRRHSNGTTELNPGGVSPSRDELTVALIDLGEEEISFQSFVV